MTDVAKAVYNVEIFVHFEWWNRLNTDVFIFPLYRGLYQVELKSWLFI